MMNLWSRPKEIPKPPPLPEYDPKEDPPTWSYSRMWFGLPIDKGPKAWTPVGTRPEADDQPDWRGVVRNNIIEYPPPKAYDVGQYNDPRYYWFDTPDYADPFKKLAWAARTLLVTGIAGSCLKGAYENLGFSLKNNAYLFRTFIAPWLGAGLAASATIITVANLRGKKDDYYNYLAGALVFGAILGRRNHVRYVQWTVVSVPFFLATKYGNEYNMKMLPMLDPRNQTWSQYGSNSEQGLASGDLRFGLRTSYGDPGRDFRTY